ncbi:hypothetical protein [Aeromicrobium terrae]|uniref:Uncharacterized protein n=1 Tax=Aeromicrobium terrae TaxID=2498846 RepID=A0A5C8NM03_9ACTN|nr:hypothetical protein [Aeromicrobium terrae]TXL61841.1 hypothetical protein FHP06_03705 [Aeromicrobium terrae]
MEGIVADGDSVVVTGAERTLTYRPRRVTVSDGTFVMHTSRGGGMSSVWFTDLGDCFVEVVHLGAGPEGGELVLVVPGRDTVAIGDLYVRKPRSAGPSWPRAVELAVGLTTPATRILTSRGEISRDELEDFHQRLLGLIHG